jgi:hypothetical protein
MAIHVYHNPYFLDTSRQPAPEVPDLASLYLAAIVDTDDPELAYHHTQHVHDDWYGHPAVTTVVRSRSTSIGDVLETKDSRLLLVASFGFRELAGRSLPARQTALMRSLRARAAAGKDQQAGVLQAVHTLYTALLFAAPLLETFAAGVDRPDPHLALLARFAAEQARWALRQCSGQALAPTGGGER